MQNVILHSRSWTALPGCFHGVPQATLLGHFIVGGVDQAAVARADAVLLEAFGDLGFMAPDADGPLGLLHRVARLVEIGHLFSGHPVSSACRFIPRERTSDEPRPMFDAALPYHDAASASVVIAWAVALLNELALGDDPDALDKARRSLEDVANRLRPARLKGINGVHFVRAAYQLGIPVGPYAREIYRYGTGRHSRALRSTLTDRTSSIGVSLARSKWEAAAVLAAAGLPTARPQRVSSPDEAVAVADSIGYPVVIKPNDKDGGTGVLANLGSALEVRQAYPETAAVTRQVVIEKHFTGQDYRLTVQDGEVVKVEQRVARGIVGDGAATVAELVRAKQASMRLQNIRREAARVPLALDNEAVRLLAIEGLTAESVPEKGRRTALTRKNNISSGGEQLAVSLADVHPDNAALAIRAARLLFLDVAGVDLIIREIGRSWHDCGGIICEVNAMPQVGVRTSPEIYREMLSRIVGEQSRIPAHLLIVDAIADSDSKDAEALAGKLGCNAISSSDGSWIDGKQVGGRPLNAFVGASSLLRDPACRSALCVMPLAQVVSEGLPLDWFDTIVACDRLLEDEALLAALRPHAGSIAGAQTDA